MTETNDNNEVGIDSPAVLVALVGVGVLGIGSFLVLPSIIIGVIAEFALDQQQIGQVSTWQLIGLGFGSVCTIFLLRRLSWRGVAGLGMSALLISDIASSVVGEFNLLLIARFCSGLSGGVCISLAAYGLGQTKQVDRNFGIFLTSQVAFAIAGSLGFPSMVDLLGLAGIFLVFCTLEIAALLFLIPRIPARAYVSSAAGRGNGTLHWCLCGVVLVGIVAYLAGIGSFWTYVAPIGMDGGLTSQQTGTAISIGLFGGLAGSYAATVWHIRSGRVPPLSLALALQLVALAMLYGHVSFITFLIAAVLFCFGWYLYLPYQFALLAAVDRDGRPMMLLNAFAGLGSGLGPAIVAGTQADGFLAAYFVCVVCLFFSFLANLSVILFARQHLAGE